MLKTRSPVLGLVWSSLQHFYMSINGFLVPCYLLMYLCSTARSSSRSRSAAPTLDISLSLFFFSCAHQLRLHPAAFGRQIWQRGASMFRNGSTTSSNSNVTHSRVQRNTRYDLQETRQTHFKCLVSQAMNAASCLLKAYLLPVS